MTMFRPAATGFFGKLPARGDFVRAGLPEDFVAAWDAWSRSALTASRAALGDAWEPAWMEAPIWRFLLPAGACGAQAVLGVWLPSMDRVGRHFPFALCALAPSRIDLEDGGAWLDVAQSVGLAGVVDDVSHEGFKQQLDAPVADVNLPLAGWWTEGSARVKPCHWPIGGLPGPDLAAAMLSENFVAEPF
jgi:type VI secretion system protein ImpM